MLSTFRILLGCWCFAVTVVLLASVPKHQKNEFVVLHPKQTSRWLVPILRHYYVNGEPPSEIVLDKFDPSVFELGPQLGISFNVRFVCLDCSNHSFSLPIHPLHVRKPLCVSEIITQLYTYTLPNHDMVFYKTSRKREAELIVAYQDSHEVWAERIDNVTGLIHVSVLTVLLNRSFVTENTISHTVRKNDTTQEIYDAALTIFRTFFLEPS